VFLLSRVFFRGAIILLVGGGSCHRIWWKNRRVGRHLLATQRLLPKRHQLATGCGRKGVACSPAAVEMREWGMILGLASRIYVWHSLELKFKIDLP